MVANTPTARKVFALFRNAGITDRADRLAVASFITWRVITSTNDMDEVDLSAIAYTLEYWQRRNALPYRCRKIADAFRASQDTAHAEP